MNKIFVAAAIISISSSASADTDHKKRCGTPNHGSEFAAEAGRRSNARAIRTVFLNKNGATFTGANQATNSSTNAVNSRIIGKSGSFVIPPISNHFNWPKISECVRTHFAKFNIRVTETEPTTGDYVEAIVGGDGREIGAGGGGLLGIAAADNFCGITERGIAFNFSESHIGIGRDDDELCATIAHEVGHLVTLYHEALAADVMSYVPIVQSGTKAFVDATSNCGTYPSQPAACDCPLGNTSDRTVNSYARLAQFIGLRPTETVPPTLAIKSPGDGKVGAVFEVVATASDDSGIDSVIAYIDNVAVGTASAEVGGEYKIMVVGAAEGAHTLKVEAVDNANNKAMQERSIEVVKLATGEDCVANEACRGGICAQAEDGNFCTESCQLDNDTCPDDFECTDIGGQSVCVGTGGGCCSASPNAGAAGLLSLLVGVALFRRRRHRK